MSFPPPPSHLIPRKFWRRCHARGGGKGPHFSILCASVYAPPGEGGRRDPLRKIERSSPFPPPPPPNSPIPPPPNDATQRKRPSPLPPPPPTPPIFFRQSLLLGPSGRIFFPFIYERSYQGNFCNHSFSKGGDGESALDFLLSKRNSGLKENWVHQRRWGDPPFFLPSRNGRNGGEVGNWAPFSSLSLVYTQCGGPMGRKRRKERSGRGHRRRWIGEEKGK